MTAHQGWLGFDDFMNMALYTPGLGYYASHLPKLGLMPDSGSDFVTAPELSSLFGRCLSLQIGQALQATRTHEVWEFGAGSGALALQVLEGLDAAGMNDVVYRIVDLSGSLVDRQRQTLFAYQHRVQWLDELPDAFEGVVLGNEVIDAMPVKLLVRKQGVWHERGVAQSDHGWVWDDRVSTLRPPIPVEGEHDYVTEVHVQGAAFVRTLTHQLVRGAVFLLDYGFPEHEYYHPQRQGGTLMCHRAHLSDDNPLVDVGLKDITAHVNFSEIAMVAQEKPDWGVLGYTSQGRFLLNLGLTDLMQTASYADRAHALKLINEHEMGELFKVIGLYRGEPWDAIGFTSGDRTYTL